MSAAGPSVGGRLVELPIGAAAALARSAAGLIRADAVPLAALTTLLVTSAASGLVVVAHGIAIALLVVLANIVHELGHVVAYRTLAPARPALLRCAGMRAALHREALPRRQDRIVTLAGPVAPLALVALAVPAAPVLPAEAAATAVIAAAHLLGLVLPTADRRAWRAAARRPSSGGPAAPTLGA